MKIRGRQSDAWNKNIDVTAGMKKPTDADFPWIALQNHTGYYMKKKGYLTQTQTETRLLSLINNHSSKEVAIAACGHHISTGALRNLIANDLQASSNNTSGRHEYLQAIVAANHVNPEAVSEIEAQSARCLSEHVAPGGSSRSLSQQLQEMLPLLAARVAPGLLLQPDINILASDVCKDFATQLEELRHGSQLMDAHAAARWLSTVSSNSTLRSSNPGPGLLLDAHLPTWGAWAAWRPHIARLRAWSDYALRAPSSMGDMFALEGPDFVSIAGSEQGTLREGLIAQGFVGSQLTLHWGTSQVSFKRNPFREHENLNGILGRLAGVVDFACSAGHEYTALLVHLCVGKIISDEVLHNLEDVRILGKPNFTAIILQAFTLPKQNLGEGINEVRELVPALSDSRLRGLREKTKAYVAERISNHVKELQNTFLKELDAGNEWNDAARELLTFICGLQEETWLLAELGHCVQLLIASGPLWMTIETLGIIRKSIRRWTSSASAVLLGQIDAYCKARLIPGWTVFPHGRRLVEALIDLWQHVGDENRLKLALLIADLSDISSQLRYDCLGDIATLSYSLVISTLSALQIPNGNPNRGVFMIIRLLASEGQPDTLERWRQVLLFLIERQHETLLHDAMTNLSSEMWLELLGSIRVIYKGSEVIRERGYPKLLSLEVHTWSQQVAIYLPTLTRLESMLEHGPAMQMLLLGSTAQKSDQLLRLLDLIKNGESGYHRKLVDTIIPLLHGGNADDIEAVLSAVCKASLRGVEACFEVLDSRRHRSPRFAEVILATKLRAGDYSEQDRLSLRGVASMFGISLDIERNPSHLTEVADTLHEQYLKLMTEAQRLESLRLSLRAVSPQDVSKLLAKLHIETSSIVDDTLASLPRSLGSFVEKISEDEIELQFSATNLTRMQRLAVGADDAESFLILLTLGHDGLPNKFCVHLSGECNDRTNLQMSSAGKVHTAWEVFSSDRPPHEQYCRGRPNRGAYQLSRILWSHLRFNFESLEQTHAYITSQVSRLGQGCIICGAGKRRLRRATTCPSQSCQSTFSQAHVEIQLVEIWQDPPVMDLLLAMIYAVALTGSLDLLEKFPASDAPTVVSMVDALPPISTIAKHLKSCLNVFEDKFNLDQALLGYCGPSSNPTSLARGLLWACSSYRGFLVSATRFQRIPSFGNNQFLLANMAPDLEIAFSRHMPTPQSDSQILFHGTSLDRLHAIICQGLRVQSGTALQRHGASYGSGIYMADEPGVAWGYATASRGGWKSSKLKSMRVLLGCELAGSKPPARSNGIYVITDATKLAVRYIFLLENNARMPAAKDVRLPMVSVFHSLRNDTL